MSIAFSVSQEFEITDVVTGRVLKTVSFDGAFTEVRIRIYLNRERDRIVEKRGIPAHRIKFIQVNAK